ncbi:MAG: hypothetical protein ACYTXA_30330 [Nostoc sp.]
MPKITVNYFSNNLLDIGDRIVDMEDGKLKSKVKLSPYSYFQVNRPRGRGTEKAHWCQLKKKSVLRRRFALIP